MAGFTIVELLVTLVIIGILASAVLPMAELTVHRAREQELRDALRQIRTALDAYKRAGDEGHIERKVDESGYPHTLDDLTKGVVDAKNPSGLPLRFLRTIPRDPFAPDDDISAAKSWGLRSYASSHEDPKVGRDVFDVYSAAPGAGLNGVRYRDW
ncbi:MAG: type II secretion system protein [Rhodocyclaceae bacterium]|nr:type II secretion system protein [Rhodocyclaceae bacterium]